MLRTWNLHCISVCSYKRDATDAIHAKCPLRTAGSAVGSQVPHVITAVERQGLDDAFSPPIVLAGPVVHGNRPAPVYGVPERTEGVWLRHRLR